MIYPIGYVMGDKMKIIGIDLGGTTIKGGLVDMAGNIIKKQIADTPDHPELILEKMASIIEDLSVGEEILGIGIGSPGFIDRKKGQVLSYGGNIRDWAWTPIQEYLLEKFPNQMIAVENDGNTAALCEKWLGSAKHLNNFIMITIGTGLGGSIYTSKEGIWNGNAFQGGEFGHAILYPKGRSCRCGQEGCVEKYVSGSAIEVEYESLTGKQIKGEEILKLYFEEEHAKKIVDNFSVNLSLYLISLKNIFDPQGIVIGGGLINASKYWWDRMMTELNHRINFEGMAILPATYLNDSGIIGAAKMIVDQREAIV